MGKKLKIRAYGLDKEAHKYSFNEVEYSESPEFFKALYKFMKKNPGMVPEHIHQTEAGFEVYWGAY